MTEEESFEYLGVSLIDDRLRLVAAKKVQDEYHVTSALQGQTRQNFDHESISDKSTISTFAEDIRKLYESQNINATDAVFALDSRFTLIKKYPVDREVAKLYLEDQINWEVQQFIISPLDQYIISYEPLHTKFDSTESVDHVIVVTVRKRIIEFVRQMFEQANLNLRVIDVDVFTAQRAVVANYDLKPTERVGLIDVESGTLNFSILEGDNFYLYYEADYSIEDHTNGNDFENKARFISKELRKIMLDYQLGRSVEDLDEIFLYGEALENRLVEELQNSHDVRIEKANPFKKVRWTGQAKENYEQPSYEKFMVAAGAAFRGLES